MNEAALDAAVADLKRLIGPLSEFDLRLVLDRALADRCSYVMGCCRKREKDEACPCTNDE